MQYRITRQLMFMEMAESAAKRSTCFRANVGAIVTHNNNVVAIGWNGPPAGEDHCTGHTCPGAQTGCTRSIHAEINALTRVSMSLTGGLELFLTHSPCAECARCILFYGRTALYVNKIYFRDLYRINDHLEGLIRDGLEVYQLTPAGFTINWKTKELRE